MKFVNFIAHYIMGKKKLRKTVCQLDAVLLVMGIVLRQFAKECKCSLANNNSKLPSVVLNKILRVIEARAFEVVAKWKDYFGEIKYYC